MFSSVPFCLTEPICRCVLVDLLCRHEDSRASAAQAMVAQRLSHRGKVVGKADHENAMKRLHATCNSTLR